MTRLESMCRTAVTFAKHWGSDWALDHVRAALAGEGLEKDSDESKGDGAEVKDDG